MKPNYEIYKEQFSSFVLNELRGFYDAIAPFYEARGSSGDSLSYFRNHFPRFEVMISLCLNNGVLPDAIKSACEIGSFYPYTTYYFKTENDKIEIDLFDIILREIDAVGEAYNINSVRLYDFNLCTDKLPDYKYDLIILSEVLEHLPINLFKFEKEIISLMPKGGHLVVTYPLHGNNAKDYGKEYPERDFERLQEDHVREFTLETVPLFFNELTLIGSARFRYPAYGKMIACLYRR